MTTVTMEALLTSDLAQVWALVTDLTAYAWRSDIRRIEREDDGRRFVEYTADGYATAFLITAFEPMTHYAFTMENSNMYGRWTGTFAQTPQGTHLTFTEEVTAKKWWMKPLVGLYLKKQQQRYLHDLKQALKTSLEPKNLEAL